MKKVIVYAFAAFAAVAAVSCAKELEEIQVVNKETHKVVITLPATKTDLDGSHTVWVEGDEILLTNGVEKDTIIVPSSADYKSTVLVNDETLEAPTTLTGKLYAIYPASAAAAEPVTGDKVNLVIPADQDGTFASANICCAVSEDYKFAMKNTTAVLSFDVPDGVDAIILNATGDALSGRLAVDLSEGVAVEPSSTNGIITVNVGGLGDKYYVAVIPGTYKAGFNATAITLDGTYQSIATKDEKTLKINGIAHLGTIGGTLSGIGGEGTEASPYLINNIAELTAFAYTVNLGNNYKDQFVKVNADIEGTLTTPVGFWKSAADQGSFAGTFDGDNRTIMLDLDGEQCKSVNYVALFGVVDSSAVIKNVKVAGKVVTTGNYAAGIVGYARAAAGDNKIKIENCTSLASVQGGERCGGIAGYATYTDFDNCSNEGTVTGETNLGGIVGYALCDTLTNVSNKAAVTATVTGGGYYARLASSLRFCWLDGTYPSQYASYSATGGVAGFFQNSAVKDAVNMAPVSGVSKVGGVTGMLYWSVAEDCSNVADITASEACAGGVTAWIYINGTVKNSVNSGAVESPVIAGGIAGFMNGGNGSVTSAKLLDCTNNGTVTATSYVEKLMENNLTIAKPSAAGGIAGMVREIANGSGTNTTAVITGCVNNADVTGAGACVAGIVGLNTTPASNTGSELGKCENHGNITGTQCVGGIMGYFFSRYTHGRRHIRNCMNDGTITAVTADKNASSCLGGIVGWMSPIYPENNPAVQNAYLTSRSQIYNCYNTGDLVCKTDSALYVGGIVGRGGHIIVYNVYNEGKISNADGLPFRSDKARVGAILGGVHGQVEVDNYYAMENVAVVGTGDSANQNMVGFKDAASQGIKEGEVYGVCDDTYEFAGSVTYKEQDFVSLIQVLNAWVGESANYYKWEEGPAFVKE